MRLSLVCCALLAVLAAMASAPAGAAACSRAAANAALRKARPHIPGPGDQQVLVTPRNADTVICFDFTRDGRPDLAVSVASGGTAGDIGWIVLVRRGKGWRLAHSQGSYKLGLARVGADVVDTVPVYKGGDPNCCPTGGFDHERWHWNGKTFVRVRFWHTKSYKP